MAYAASLRHVGEPASHPTLPIVVLKRPIGNSGLHDALSPWPYLWLTEHTIEALRMDFRPLVSLSIVAQPGFVPGPEVDHVLLKEHFVYDPAFPAPELSARAQRRLAVCARSARFEIVGDMLARMEMTGLYRALAARRTFTPLFDMDETHFAVLAGLPEAVFFRVVHADGRLGAMACGVVFGDMLQLLHLVPSRGGLTWNASYLLMAGLQDFARQSRLRLLLGGMPDGAQEGLRLFKARWCNRRLPVHLIRIINDRDAYAALCGTAGGPHDYFPAYRSAVQ